MTWRERLACGLAVASAALVPGPTHAQAPPPARVTLMPAAVVFPSPTEASFDAGWIEHGGMVVTVEPRNPNRPNWHLFIRATDADMGGYGKPVGDIVFRVDGASGWTPLSTTPQPLAEGSHNRTITVFFRLLLDWLTDGPGTYQIPFEITSSTS
jgi:hypothetical protein